MFVISHLASVQFLELSEIVNEKALSLVV
jgi:hypothetical protein